jgi:hypothetical protein
MKKKLVCGSNPHLSFNRPLRAAHSEVAWWVSAAWKAIPETSIKRNILTIKQNTSGRRLG